MENKIIKKLIKKHMGKIGENLCQKEGVGGKLYPSPLPRPLLYFRELHIPSVNISACLATVVVLATVSQIFSIPDMELLAN